MRMLFLGDIFGQPGLDAVTAWVPRLRRDLALDAVVANCENVAGGRGITPQTAEALLQAGVDVLTGGNHSWRHRDIVPYIRMQPRLIRPCNHPAGTAGHGSYRLELPHGLSLGVFQVEGQVFMSEKGCPFAAVEAELTRLGPVTARFLDVHAEASSEKQALAWHFDGRLSAVIGSHTHVPTADARLLPGGTAYLTDAGMTGPYDSIIGVDVKNQLRRFHRKPSPFQVATDNVQLCGAVVDIDEATGQARHIERLQRAYPPAAAKPV